VAFFDSLFDVADADAGMLGDFGDGPEFGMVWGGLWFGGQAI
jgi:hypothetical protein